MTAVEFIHCTPAAEALIVKMARVSNPKNEDNQETAPRLLHYLIGHKEWSPFEMASMCVKINTTRDISAQICRHRSFSFQEFSSRYAEMPSPALPELRAQAAKNRQSSTDDLPEHVRTQSERIVASTLHNVYLLYKDLLDAGVARECARRILPLCTPTTLYMHGTLRSWIHFIQLRTQPDTQLEHREVADLCKNIFISHFPTIALAAFGDLSQPVQE